MPFDTELTRRLGIKIPVVQGGMQHVGYAELASAVSNAGGLGILTALTQPTPEDLRKEIRKTRTMTKNPFGVNITLLPTLQPPDYGAFAQVVKKCLYSQISHWYETTRGGIWRRACFI
ncbi:hypothetical protein O1611_g2551 [Lasiodiplodia mahajangana]|uniref:Uncharacterized protein n=1 Tax=Lasiodiplodia mahajangana TaxID=1108764 RepID=A0ACC2JU60_9PEZI|nr:hypothetical protein O1611_g2551 [Lasiodiplodia mahajangana]